MDGQCGYYKNVSDKITNLNPAPRTEAKEVL